MLYPLRGIPSYRRGGNAAIYPSIGGWDALLKGAHRYGPIGENINDAAFSA